MAGETFEQLLGLGELKQRRPGIRFEGLGLNQDIKEATALERSTGGRGLIGESRKAADAVEAEISARIEKDIAERKKNIATYGTNDPKRIAAIKATGVFDADFATRMQMDPEGSKAAYERAVALSERGGVQDAPDGPDPQERTFSAGTGAHGERYFTNLSREELHEQKRTADTIRGSQSAPPVTDLKVFKPGRTGMGGEGAMPAGAKSPEELEFEGRLDEARSIAEKPDRDMKHAQTLEAYGQSLLDVGRSEDVTTARQRLQDDLLGGKHKSLGIKPAEAKAIDALLIKRAKSTIELAQPGVDRTFFMPWHKSSKKPGLAADKAEPATVLNPGGQEPTLVQAKQGRMMAEAGMEQHISETGGRELPRTADYSGIKPSPAETPGLRSPSTRPATPASRRQRKNPVDEFVERFTPAPGIDPQVALRRRAGDIFGEF